MLDTAVGAGKFNATLVAGNIQNRRVSSSGWISLGELVRLLFLPHSQAGCAAVLAEIKRGRQGNLRCPFSANNDGQKVTCVEAWDERTAVIPIERRNGDIIVVHYQHHRVLTERRLRPIKELTDAHVSSLLEYFQSASLATEAVA